MEDGEPRTEAYTEDELLLVEMGWKYGFDAGKQQTKPLSDDEILEILIDKGICGRLKDGSLCYWQADADLHDFARAIEERHGIK